ncbi:MAG: hypothetical protein LDL10_02430, partial [Calditerrivibrio sp.]|nr:hypothetical protein [Calditerrivibrio sp.]
KNIIKSIKITGGKSFLNSVLLSFLGVSTGDPIYFDTFYIIKEKLEKYYKSMGFRDVNVFVHGENGNILIAVDEGPRYYIDEIVLKYGDIKSVFRFDKRFFTPDVLNEYIDKFRKNLQLEGIWGVSLIREEIFKQEKGVFWDLLLVDPFSMIFGKNILVKSVIEMSGGSKFNFVIDKNIAAIEDKKFIEDFIASNLKSFDPISIREVELHLEEALSERGYVKPEVEIDLKDGVINLHINFEDIVKSIKVIISANGKKLPISVETYLKELIAVGSFEEAKKRIVNILNSMGYLNAKVLDYSLTQDDNNIIFLANVSLGDGVTIIREVYLDGEKILENVGLAPDEKNIEKVRKRLLEVLSTKKFVKEVYFEKNEGGRYYFKSETRDIEITDILSNSEKLDSKVKRKFFSKDPFLTTEKFIDIRDYIITNKNAENLFIDFMEFDNKSILILNKLDGKPNRFFGSLSYDSLDRISGEIGYSRFDILNSSRTFSAMVRGSFNENSINFSLLGRKTVLGVLDDYYLLSYKERDESDFEYKQFSGESSFRFKKNIFEMVFGVKYELSEIQNTDFNIINNSRYMHNFKILSIPLSFTLKSRGFELYNDRGLRGSFGEQLSFSNSSNFQIHRLSLEGYETFNNRYFFDVVLDFNKITGDDVPLYYLLTLGGPKYMKAFSYRDLGRKDPDTGATIGDKSTIYSKYMFGYKPMDNIIFGPFFEYAAIGEDFGKLKYYKDIGVELLITVKELGNFGFSYAYNPFDPYKGKQAFYINFGVNF